MADARRVAIVGAHGFLGSAISRAVTDTGHETDAYDLDRPFLVGERLAGAAPDVVVWAASTVNPAIAADHPDRAVADLDALAKALRALEREAPAALAIFLSSGGTVYGPPSEPPYRETELLHPVNEYGFAKAQAEGVLRASGVRGTVIRVANAYGPAQRPAPGQGVIAHWLRAARVGEPIRVFGDLDTSRDYVYAEDVAGGVLAVVEATAAPEVVNIGSGQPASLASVLALVLDVTGASHDDVIHETARRIDTAHTWLAVEVARDRLGWEPRVSLADGIAAAWRGAPTG